MRRILPRIISPGTYWSEMLAFPPGIWVHRKDEINPVNGLLYRERKSRRRWLLKAKTDPFQTVTKANMSTQAHVSPTAKELLLGAFQNYLDDEANVVSIVDQILTASVELPKLELAPTASGHLTVTIGNGEDFEVRLPRNSVASFRTLLARIGVICDSAAKKRSMAGKAEAFLMRTGIKADKMVTERKHPAIQYVSAVIRDQPATPLYKVEADLVVIQPNGLQTSLQIVMQNNGQNLLLRIETRSHSLP